MRDREPGEPLIVTGLVRSTSGQPIAGATVDVWQPDANSIYSDLSGEDFGHVFNIENDSSGPSSSPTSRPRRSMPGGTRVLRSTRARFRSAT